MPVWKVFILVVWLQELIPCGIMHHPGVVPLISAPSGQGIALEDQLVLKTLRYDLVRYLPVWDGALRIRTRSRGNRS